MHLLKIIKEKLCIKFITIIIINYFENKYSFFFSKLKKYIK